MEGERKEMKCHCGAEMKSVGSHQVLRYKYGGVKFHGAVPIGFFADKYCFFFCERCRRLYDNEARAFNGYIHEDDSGITVSCKKKTGRLVGSKDCAACAGKVNCWKPVIMIVEPVYISHEPEQLKELKKLLSERFVLVYSRCEEDAKEAKQSPTPSGNAFEATQSVKTQI